MIVVPDAGPLIYLAGAGQLELLPALYSQVVVPRIMFHEIVVAGAGLTGAREVEGASWLQVQDMPVEPSLLATLDRGEAAAIPLAERLGATLLADDARAREVARERGLVVIGTLGVLLVAKEKGLLPAHPPNRSPHGGYGHVCVGTAPRSGARGSGRTRPLMLEHQSTLDAVEGYGRRERRARAERERRECDL